MKLISYDKYMKMSKPALIRKITKALRAMPKKKLARLCYNITKSKLPRLKITRRERYLGKQVDIITGERKKRKTKKKLKAGIHFVIINGVQRKVKVNSKGQWRFMKYRPKSKFAAGRLR